MIAPVCRAFADRGVVGPLPADTLFTQRQLAGADAVLAMYHDQGLPVLKHVGFGNAVNVTLGPADRAHVGRSRHGARPRGPRRRRHRQLRRGDRTRRKLARS